MNIINPKSVIAFLLLFSTQLSFAQKDNRISTVDFVQIVDGNRAETLFYYEHNWKVLRVMALEKKYIASFEIMETASSEEAPFHLMLITTYANSEQYAQREAHFQELIKAKGKLELLNDKKPPQFRKNLFNKGKVMHHSTEISIKKG